jgi:IS30 family transposase
LNSVKGKYDPKKAHYKARLRRQDSKYQGMKIVRNSDLQNFVDKNLYDDQSPEAISNRLKNIEKNLPYVSKDSVYRYIKSVYGRRIEAYRNRTKTRRWRRRAKSKKLKDRTFIDKRPAFINKRYGLGHMEADFIESGKSGKGVLLVVVDRKTRITFIERIIKADIKNVHKAFAKIKQRYPEMKTLTLDNDILFQKHKELEKLLRVKIYFCNPYHSWEKGTVENVNGIIRRHISKGSNISKYSKQYIMGIEAKLNRRFLKCLDSLTPCEALEKKRKQKSALSAK